MFAAPNSKLTKSFIDLAARYTNRQTITPIEEVESEPKRDFFSRALNVLFG